MIDTHKFETVDEYIYSFEGATRERLEDLRTLIKQALPEAEERISYNIPAYFAGKAHVIYFAGYTDFVSIYPVYERDNPDVVPYLSGKASARFLNEQPLPQGIITETIKTKWKAAVN